MGVTGSMLGRVDGGKNYWSIKDGTTVVGSILRRHRAVRFGKEVGLSCQVTWIAGLLPDCGSWFLRGNFKCTLELVKFEVLVGHRNVGVQ